MLGEKHPNAGTSIHTLVSTYSSQGRWNEAEELQRLALEMSKSRLGERRPDTLTGTS